MQTPEYKDDLVLFEVAFDGDYFTFANHLNDILRKEQCNAK